MTELQVRVPMPDLHKGARCWRREPLGMKEDLIRRACGERQQTGSGAYRRFVAGMGPVECIPHDEGGSDFSMSIAAGTLTRLLWVLQPNQQIMSVFAFQSQHVCRTNVLHAMCTSRR